MKKFVRSDIPIFVAIFSVLWVVPLSFINKPLSLLFLLIQVFCFGIFACKNYIE